MAGTDQLMDGGNKRLWMDAIQYILIPLCWMLSRLVLILGGFCTLIASAISRFVGELWLPGIIRWAVAHVYGFVFALVVLLGILSLLLRGSGVRTGWVRLNALWRWGLIIYLFLAMFGAGKAYQTIEQLVADVPTMVLDALRVPTIPTTVGIVVDGTRYAPFDASDPAVAAAQRVMTPLQDVSGDGRYQPSEVVLSLWRATPADVYGGVPGVTMETPDGPVSFAWMPADFQALFFGDDTIPWYEGDFTTDPNGAAKRRDALGIAGQGLWQALTGTAGAIGASLEGIVRVMLTLGTFLAIVMVALTAPLAMLGHNALWVGGFVKGAITMILGRIGMGLVLGLVVRLFYGTVAEPGIATSHVLAGVFLLLYAVLTWRFFGWTRATYAKTIAPVRAVVGAMRDGQGAQDTRTVTERAEAQQTMGFAETKPEAVRGDGWRAGTTTASAAHTGRVVAAGGASGALPGVGIAGLVRDDLAEIDRERRRPPATVAIPRDGATGVATDAGPAGAASSQRVPFLHALRDAVDGGGNGADVARTSATPLGHRTAIAGQYVQWARAHGVSGADAAALVHAKTWATPEPALDHLPADAVQDGQTLAWSLAAVEAAAPRLGEGAESIKNNYDTCYDTNEVASMASAAVTAPPAPGSAATAASAPIIPPADASVPPLPGGTAPMVVPAPGAAPRAGDTAAAALRETAASHAVAEPDGHAHPMAPGAVVSPPIPGAAPPADATLDEGAVTLATPADPVAAGTPLPAASAGSASVPPATVVPAAADAAAPGLGVAPTRATDGRPADPTPRLERPAPGAGNPARGSAARPAPTPSAVAAPVEAPRPSLAARIDAGVATFEQQATATVERSGLAIEHHVEDAVDAAGTASENVPPRIDQAAEDADVALSGALGVSRSAAQISADRTFADAPKRTLDDVLPAAAPPPTPPSDRRGSPAAPIQTRLRPRPAPLEPAAPTAQGRSRRPAAAPKTQMKDGDQ